MKEKAYIFDVDGTLTPSCGILDSEFEKEFLEFASNHTCYLITGSDRPKTYSQVGPEVYDSCKQVYQCNGAEVWEQNRRVKSSDWTPPHELKSYLKNIAHHSRCPVKTNNQIEVRTGMVNFSTVGRSCTPDQRKQYYLWDKMTQERKYLASNIEKKFDDINAVVGGQISIDIYPKGQNKSMIANDLASEYELIFFGDKTEHGGNDYPLAMMIELGDLGKTHQVDGWEQTRQLLLVIGNKLEEKK